MRNMRRFASGLLIFAVVLVVVLSLTLILTGVLRHKEIREIPIHFIVGDHVGINLDTNAVNFGTVKQGSGYRLQREMVIGNELALSRQVQMTVTGDIAPLVSVSPSAFILAPGENRAVNITLTTIPTLPEGNYTGILRATLYDN